jgi:chemotaxis family two-component system response regulator Rcp1
MAIPPTTNEGKAAGSVHILVVEDNPGDVYLLGKTLKNLEISYELTTYVDGEQAIRALQKDDCATPDLIILDLNLPRREGFEVLQTIRGKPSMVGVPVAILTSSDAAKDRHRISVTGHERYIHKPPELEDFLKEVGQAIEDLLK